MIPWVQLGTATIPGSGDKLRLMQRGAEFSILSGPITLMNSRMSSSEIALAQLVCQRVSDRNNCRILIGGYGMGFTLRAALAELGARARVTVSELVPEVVEWARGPMAELTAGGLSDPRVNVVEGDVGAVIANAKGSFDAIVLDVDNGPDGLSRKANNRLYDHHGLKAAREALRPGGLLAIWSASPSAEFAKRLSGAGFAVDEVKERAHKGRGVRHIIWIATKRG